MDVPGCRWRVGSGEYDTAASQEGLFATRQAAAAGYPDPLLAHYQKSGRIARIRRGIYRLVHFPAGEQEELGGGGTPSMVGAGASSSPNKSDDGKSANQKENVTSSKQVKWVVRGSAGFNVIPLPALPLLHLLLC
jgi:hypothetical protein